MAAGYAVRENLESRFNELRLERPTEAAPEMPEGYSKEGKRSVGKSVEGPTTPEPLRYNHGVWAVGSGDFGSYRGSSNWNAGQLTLGADTRLSPSWVVGILASVQRAYGHLSPGTFDAWDERIGLYSTYWKGGWWLQGAILGGLDQYEVHSPGQHGSDEGWTLTGYAGTGYDWHAGAFTFGPFASFQFDKLHIDRQGTGNLGQARLGARASVAAGRWHPYVAAAAEAQVLDRSLRYGAIADRNAVWGQAGIAYDVSARFAVFADYSIEKSTRYTNQQVNIGAGYSW